MTRLAALLLGALLVYVAGVQTGMWVQRTRTVPIVLSARPCVENPRENCFADFRGREMRVDTTDPKNARPYYPDKTCGPLMHITDGPCNFAGKTAEPDASAGQ